MPQTNMRLCNTPEDTFLRRYEHIVLAIERLNPRLCAHELRSACFESLWLNQSRIESANNPTALARTICRRRALDLFRRIRPCCDLDNVPAAASSDANAPAIHDLTSVLGLLAKECTTAEWRVVVGLLTGEPRAKTAERLHVSGPRISQLRSSVTARARRLASPAAR